MSTTNESPVCAHPDKIEGENFCTDCYPAILDWQRARAIESYRAVTPEMIYRRAETVKRKQQRARAAARKKASVA